MDNFAHKGRFFSIVADHLHIICTCRRPFCLKTGPRFSETSRSNRTMAAMFN